MCGRTYHSTGAAAVFSGEPLWTAAARQAFPLDQIYDSIRLYVQERRKFSRVAGDRRRCGCLFVKRMHLKVLYGLHRLLEA